MQGLAVRGQAAPMELSLVGSKMAPSTSKMSPNKASSFSHSKASGGWLLDVSNDNQESQATDKSFSVLPNIRIADSRGAWVTTPIKLNSEVIRKLTYNNSGNPTAVNPHSTNSDAIRKLIYSRSPPVNHSMIYDIMRKPSSGSIGPPVSHSMEPDMKSMRTISQPVQYSTISEVIKKPADNSSLPVNHLSDPVAVSQRLQPETHDANSKTANRVSAVTNNKTIHTDDSQKHSKSTDESHQNSNLRMEHSVCSPDNETYLSAFTGSNVKKKSKKSKMKKLKKRSRNKLTNWKRNSSASSKSFHDEPISANLPERVTWSGPGYLTSNDAPLHVRDSEEGPARVKRPMLRYSSEGHRAVRGNGGVHGKRPSSSAGADVWSVSSMPDGYTTKASNSLIDFLSNNNAAEGNNDANRATTQDKKTATHKVYYSDAQSSMLKELGRQIPCAPPVTPVPAFSGDVEYIPCMSDIRSQRAVKVKLEAINKAEKKRQERIKQEEHKKEKIVHQEKLDDLKKQQRLEIYALNKLMTELEHANFMKFQLNNIAVRA